MKAHSASLLVSSVAVALTLGATSVVAADNSSQAQNNQSQASGQNKQADVRSAKDAEKTWEQTHRASKVIGSDIVNAKGDKVGTVKDLVLDDPASGQITRVVVSVGGVGGLGDKLFAVPYSDLKRDQAKNRLVLNADSDLAHAFNDNNWQALGNQGGSSTAQNGSSSATASTTPPASSSTASSAPSSNSSASNSSANNSSASNSSSTTSPSTTASTGSTTASSNPSGNSSNTVIGAPSSSNATGSK